MLILDFDGTVTDAEREGAPYRAGYLKDLATLTGLSGDEITARAERIEADIQANPDRHGWEFYGRVVAPAMVDPYLRTMRVAKAILDEQGLFLDAGDRERLFALLYEHNYQKTENAFRDGAHALFTALAGSEVHVVTNSHTEPVQAKIRALARAPGEFDWLVERVRGLARKYIVDDDFELPGLDPTLALSGLERPVYLRRRHYHKVIAGLLDEAGESFDDLAVVGDIFELDLALPLALGARVALMANAFTPRYEITYLEAHPRGHVLGSLAEIPAFAAGDAG